ncbi:MAG: MobV family relaxase [Clostridium sp.]
MNFAIFRIGKKYKSIDEIRGFEKHTERKQETPNANISISNELLVGSSNIVSDVENYIDGIKLRKNGVLARDLLLTTSPEWFKDSSEELKREWINSNVKWLLEQFGGNLIYCVCHNDEKSIHIHALIVPRFYDAKKDKYSLSNRNYFNGAAVLSEWQDKYSNAMEGLGLSRGLKWSKAKHTDIKTFYNLINKNIEEKDIEVLTAKAKHGEILCNKVKSLQKTLNSYSNINNKSVKEKEMLTKEIKSIQSDKEIYKECIRTMSELYKIPQGSIEKVIKYVSQKSQDTEREKH